MKRINQALKSATRAAAGWVPDAMLAAGAAAVSYGVGLVHQPSGVIVAGLFTLAAGWLLARGAR